MNLGPHLFDFAENYSRGTKKKLGLLLALLHRPKLLALDEATNGLDVETTHFFHGLMSSLSRDGTTVLFSTHLMDHVARVCTHAVIINDGTVMAKGSLDDLRARFGSNDLEEVFLAATAKPALL